MVLTAENSDQTISEKKLDEITAMLLTAYLSEFLRQVEHHQEKYSTEELFLLENNQELQINLENKNISVENSRKSLLNILQRITEKKAKECFQIFMDISYCETALNFNIHSDEKINLYNRLYKAYQDFSKHLQIENKLEQKNELIVAKRKSKIAKFFSRLLQKLHLKKTSKVKVEPAQKKQFLPSAETIQKNLESQLQKIISNLKEKISKEINEENLTNLYYEIAQAYRNLADLYKKDPSREEEYLNQAYAYIEQHAKLQRRRSLTELELKPDTNRLRDRFGFSTDLDEKIANKLQDNINILQNISEVKNTEELKPFILLCVDLNLSVNRNDEQFAHEVVKLFKLHAQKMNLINLDDIAKTLQKYLEAALIDLSSIYKKHQWLCVQCDSEKDVNFRDHANKKTAVSLILDSVLNVVSAMEQYLAENGNQIIILTNEKKVQFTPAQISAEASDLLTDEKPDSNNLPNYSEIEQYNERLWLDELIEIHAKLLNDMLVTEKLAKSEHTSKKYEKAL